MKWPFIRRSTMDMEISSMQARLDLKDIEMDGLRLQIKIKSEIIDELRDTVAIHLKEVASLTSLLTSPAPKKCNDYTTATENKEVIPTMTVITPGGRGGWRARRAAAERETIPKEKDSMTQLNERVQAQGGTI